MPTKVKIKLVI